MKISKKGEGRCQPMAMNIVNAVLNYVVAVEVKDIVLLSNI